jgi:hypothetical protein
MSLGKSYFASILPTLTPETGVECGGCNGTDIRSRTLDNVPGVGWKTEELWCMTCKELVRSDEVIKPTPRYALAAA